MHTSTLTNFIIVYVGLLCTSFFKIQSLIQISINLFLSFSKLINVSTLRSLKNLIPVSMWIVSTYAYPYSELTKPHTNV